MNRHKFIYYGTLPNLNNYLQAERISYRKNGKMHTKGNDMKQECQMLISNAIRLQLKRLHISTPVHIEYVYYEPDKRRDLDNISATAHKFIQDALVKCGVLENDGWSCIKGFSDAFYIDKSKPRIEVELIELESG